MLKIITAIAATAIMSLGSTTFSLPASAETSISAPVSGEFIRKQKSIKGSWEIVQRGDQSIIVFGDDFRAKNGPDLKVFLSPKSVADVTGKTATNGAVLISTLSSTKGQQEYVIPAGVKLSDFESVLVHCEAYSVVWGGGDL